MLHADGITNNMDLTLKSYSTAEGTTVGAWALLKAGQQEGSRSSSRFVQSQREIWTPSTSEMVRS